MNDNANPDNDQTFQKLLADCLESLEHGEPIDRDRLRRDHPGHADSICEFLDNNDLVADAIVGLRDGDEKPAVDTAFAPTKDSHSQNPSKLFEIGDSLRYVGEYEIVDEIARGGMGIVFRARQSKLRRDVALKMILSGRLASEADVDRFHREARAAASLKHPNIVGVHEVGQHEGHHYFTMDLVDGKSLASIISEETLSPRKAAELIKKVALAIEYAHEHGVLHRDLKPANILIDADGQPHVTDFGLAKSLIDDATNVELTATGQILGTPSYMAPEQASAKHQIVNVASDVYSLGAILYACLSGRAPFVADSAVDTIRQVLEKEPVAPRLLSPQIPKDLETICLKCLQKEPGKRYTTAQELADDLGRFLEGRPIAARPVGVIGKTARWCRRNSLVAALLMMVALSFAGGTVGSAYFAIQENRRAEAEATQRQRADEQTEIARKAQRLTAQSLRKEEAARWQAEQSKAEAEREKETALTAQRRAVQAKESETQQRKLADQARTLAQWQTYVARLQPIQQASQEQEWGHLDRLLREMIPPEGSPDFRGWEWYFFDAQVRTVAPRLNEEHQFDGYFVHDRPRNRLLAQIEKKWTLWDLKTRTLVKTLSVPRLRDHSLTVSPDGKLLAGAQFDSEVVVWDIERDQRVTGLVTDVVPLERDRDAFAQTTQWNPDGSQLLTVSRRGEIRIWDTIDWKLERTLQERSHRNTMGGIDWHPEAGLLTGHRFGWFRIWDVEAGKVIHTGKCRNAIIEHVKWSPAGDKFALATDGLGVFNSEGERIGEHLASGLTTSIAWLTKDELVVGGDEQNVVLYDANAASVTNTIRIQSGQIRSLSLFSDDVVLSGSADGSLKFTRLSENHPQIQRIAAHDAAAMEVEWSPDGSKLATAGLDSHARVWDAANMQVIHQLTGHRHEHVWDVAWNNQGDRLATIDHVGGLNLYDAADGSIKKQSKVLNIDHPRLDWRPSEEHLIFGGNRLQIMGASTLQREWIADTKDGWRIEMHFSPDATRAAGVSKTGNCIFVDVEQREFLARRNLDDPGTGAGAWSPDGKRFVAAGTDLNLIKTDTFKPVKTFEGHHGPIGGVCFNPTGTRLCSVGSDGLVYVWDVATGDLLVRIPVLESGLLNAVEWSPDGKSIAMVSDTGELILLGSNDVGIQADHLKTIDENAMRLQEELLALSRAIETEPEQPYHYVQRAEWYAKHLAFKEAQTDLERYLQQRPTSGWQRCEAAYAALAIGDQDAYARHLAVNLEELSEYVSWEKTTTGYVVSAACLRADSTDDFSQLLPLAKYSLEDKPITFHEMRPLFMLQLRLGENETVLRLLEPYRDRGKFHNQQIFVDSLRAIALARLGRANEAREALVKAETHARSTWKTPNQEYEFDYGDLKFYVEAGSFLDEARKSVQPVPLPR